MKTLALLARLAQQRLDEKRAGLFELTEQHKRLEAHLAYLDTYLTQEAKIVEKHPEYQTQFYFFRRNIEERCTFLQGNQAILQERLQAAQEEMRAIFQEKKSYEFLLEQQAIEKHRNLLREEQKILDEIASNQFSSRKNKQF